MCCEVFRIDRTLWGKYPGGTSGVLPTEPFGNLLKGDEDSILPVDKEKRLLKSKIVEEIADTEEIN